MSAVHTQRLWLARQLEGDGHAAPPPTPERAGLRARHSRSTRDEGFAGD